MTKLYESDEDAFDENGVMRDGKGLRVSLHLMDGLDDVQRAIAAGRTPGDAREAAFNARIERAKDAWRNPLSQPAVDAKPVSMRPAGPQTRDAAFEARGLRMKEAWRHAEQQRVA